MSLATMSYDRRRNLSATRRRFYQSVIQKDGCCLNTKCFNPRECLQAHHIIYRSHGGANHLSNGITLCVKCHDRVHRGFTDPAARRITGRSYMIKILEQLRGTPVWRWDVAYQYLLRRICS